MKLVSVEQMKALEKQANQQGLSYESMMANAGMRLAEVIHKRYFKRPIPKVLGLVGTGNNGGDTLVALKHLAEWGWQTQAYLVKARDASDKLVSAYLDSNGKIIQLSEDKSFSDLKDMVISADCILDGILGTGIKLPIKGNAKKALEIISSMQDLPPIIAVDCPSGVDCDSGKAAKRCLKAEITICMAAIKQGLLKQPALNLSGEILAVDIGLSDDLSVWQGIDTDVMDAHTTARLLPERPNDGHKGTFGTAMIAAGSINYCGAVLLAVKAAYRVGTGLVQAAIPGAIYDTLAGQMPEATWLILPHTLGVLNGEGADIIRNNLERVNALLIGPGWGQESETFDLLQRLLDNKNSSSKKMSIGFSGVDNNKGRSANELPNLIIDADALKLLAKIEGWEKMIGNKAVLTPHPGEMAVLTGLDIKSIQSQREDIAKEYAQRWGHVVVLKGAVTVVADMNGKSALIPIASSALATAGTGDVLAGLITGLIAQGVEPFKAAKAGAWLHAKAGLLAAKKIGSAVSVMAGDVVDALPLALKQTSGR